MHDKKSDQDNIQLRRVQLIRYVLPFVLFIIVAFYETWEHVVLRGSYQFDFHLTSEVMFFGVFGPTAVFIAMKYVVSLLEKQINATRSLGDLNRNLENIVAERTEALEERNAELAAANLELQKLDELKSDFVSLVSHELRGPLTTLNGGLELALQDRKEMSEESRRILEVIAAESERLTEFVQTILDVSRLQAGKMNINLGPVAVSPLLERSIEVAFAGKSREVICCSDHASLPPVWADEVYLEQVLSNLLNNADKYSPPDKPITIDTQRSNGSIEIQVIDHGSGIPEEKQHVIFERFQRLESGNRVSAQGWGLGLYFSKALAEAQNCGLEVKSPVHPEEEYPGTAFILKIPLMMDVPEDG